jgi:hypothetical protein
VIARELGLTPASRAAIKADVTDVALDLARQMADLDGDGSEGEDGVPAAEPEGTEEAQRADGRIGEDRQSDGMADAPDGGRGGK